MKKTFYAGLLFFTLVSFGVYYNDNFEKRIVEKLEAYDSKNYPEKVYVHTDKPYYSLDESIWFTGYLVNGVSHLKSKKSYVMHVELINEQDSIVGSKKLFINKISSPGDFKIDKKWQPGKYLLRAYTNEMRNDDPSFFFQKEITVMGTANEEEVNNEESKEAATNQDEKDTNYTIPRPDVSFHPEGGYLIDNLTNKVALKIKNRAFHEQTLDGFIVDNNDNKIFSFTTTKFGLGLFVITPEPNKTYTAIIDINGSEERYPLPKSLHKGYTISTSNIGTKIGLNVSSNMEEGLKGSILVAHQRGKLLYRKVTTSNKDNYHINFPTSKLDDGIIHITLFDPQGNPVSERLIYVENPENNLTVDIEHDKKKLGTREKVTLQITPKDNQGKTVVSSLSMAIRDMQAVPQNNFVENIKTYLLLNSDLRGEIKNPGYFFEIPNDPKRRYLLDLMMMTHGWRRFSWQSLLDENQPSRDFKPERGIFIKGKTKNLKKPYDYRSTATRLTFMGKSIHQEAQQSDSLGNFTYGPFIFFDQVPTLIEARLYDFKSEKSKNRNVVILLDNETGTPPEISRKDLLQTTVSDDAQLEAYLKVSKYINQVNLEYEQQMQLLDEVVVVGKKKTELEKRNEEFDSRTMHGYSDKRVVTEDITGAESMTIFDLLLGIAGVQVSGTSVSIRGGGSPKFMLDGMPIDSTFVESLSGMDIDFIDVLQGADAAVYSNSGNGVIALYSRLGSNISSKNVKRKPGIMDFKAEGFYTAREFYAPDHINGFEEMSKADIRTTLHWEPNLTTKIDQPTEISFFTSDTRGDFIIEVQGISETGMPIHSISTMTVK
ncbi:TonB-dependent receptor [Flavicella marina]|uniref:TonB-dependent receptor n=1 Tax=Flavicella marina TaxID=1475951 RepID=UPI00126586BD|nr:Plug domain-containing protein [Flavicella marina]